MLCGEPQHKSMNQACRGRNSRPIELTQNSECFYYSVYKYEYEDRSKDAKKKIRITWYIIRRQEGSLRR